MLFIIYHFVQPNEHIHGSATNLGIYDSVANLTILEPFNDLWYVGSFNGYVCLLQDAFRTPSTLHGTGPGLAHDQIFWK